MKKIVYLSVALMGILAFVSCEGFGQKGNGDEDTLAVVPLNEIPEIEEVRGRVGDGSSMNVLELITGDNDTLNIEVSASIIAGGLMEGDEMDVIFSRLDSALVSTIAINVTTLQHLWTQRSSQGGTQSLEINPDGNATTYNMGNIDYDHWSLLDGQLLLHSPRLPGVESSGYTDTFDILMLTNDTLVLSAGDAQSIFWREN